MTLTRREKHVLIIFAIVALFFIIFNPDQSTTETIEYFGLLFVVFPLGLYIASDPERKKEEK
jgi:hypothetical protein